MAVGTKKLSGRSRRKIRIRKRVRGSATRPRLSVFRSARHIYAQLINDDSGETLAAASTVEPAEKSADGVSKKDAAAEVGRRLAARAKEVSIEQVVFDRNGYLYHGRVKAVAEGARETGLQF